MGDTTGTFTFLFTDVEESTRRWAEDRDAMSSAMARHDAVLREAIESIDALLRRRHESAAADIPLDDLFQETLDVIADRARA